MLTGIWRRTVVVNNGTGEMATEIIGRDEELASIGAFLDRVQEGPAALVLSGEAGIGKTSLWEAGAEEAQHRFGRVLSHRSAEAEASLSFTGLSDLLAPVFADIAPCLAPPRRRALEVALLFAEPGETAPDSGAIGLAVLDILRALTDRGPVLVALDDIQWLDSPSAAVLQIALRRLGDEPLGVLATLRDAPDVATPLVLERAFPEERLTRLSLGSLSLGALHRLLAERIGLELTRPEVVRVQEASGGIRSSRSSSGGSWFARASARLRARNCVFQTASASSSAPVLPGCRRRPEMSCSSPLRSRGRRSSWLRRRTATDSESSTRSRPPPGKESSNSTTPAFVSPTRWLPRSATSRRRSGSAAPSTAHSPTWSRTSRSGHAILRLPPTAPTRLVASELERAADQAAARGATAAAAELSELAAELTPDDPALDRSLACEQRGLYRLAGDTDRAVVADPRAASPRGSVRGRSGLTSCFALALTRRADTSVLLSMSAARH